MHEMTPIRLTIGIPTYNFGKFIGETLDAFLAQLPDAVEILVVDGASTDDTAQVVAARTASGQMLRYVCLPARGGIDADVAEVMTLARGEFVWLFSADDVPVAGAVSAVLAIIGDDPDVAIVAHAGATIDLAPVYPRYPIVTGGNIDDRIMSPAARLTYFRRAVTTEAFFSFLSGLVIRRETWHTAPVPDKYFYGSCWAHAARLLALVGGDGLHLKVCVEPLLVRRGDNDSFRTAGIASRYALAIDGYLTIFEQVFGAQSAEAGEVRRVLRFEFSFRSFLAAKLAGGGRKSEDQTLLRLFARIYDRGLFDRAGRTVLATIPLPAVSGLFHLKRLINRMRR